MFEFKNIKYKDIIDIDELFINEGSITVILGRSGGGKTTLLKLMNKLISPDSGDILYFNENLEYIDSVSHRRNVTMLSQTPVIFDGTIKDNLIKGLIYQKKDIPEDRILIEFLKKVSLDKNLDESAVSLSGGEKQRLAIARVLLLDSEVILVDEPSSALDSITEEKIFELLSDYSKKNGKTLIMVTHSRDSALKFAHKVIEIEKGRILNEWNN